MPEQPADPDVVPPFGQATQFADGDSAPPGAATASTESAIAAALGADPAEAPAPLDAPEQPAGYQISGMPHGFGEEHGTTAELDEMLHHKGVDLEIHSDFEAEAVAVSAHTLPGRTAPGSRRTISFLRRMGWGFWVAVGWVVFVILLAILAPILPIPDPSASTCGVPNAAPSPGHLLGCDDIGRDVLSRVIWGSRVSLVVGFVSIAAALAVGGSLAVVAGYIRGAIDSVLSVLTNTLLAYPYIVLGLAIVTFWGHSEFQVIVVIAIIAVAPLYRVVRANTIAFAERDYVLAATALGSKRKRVLRKQIIPDVIPTAITYALVGVALAIVGEGALSFVGQSVPPNTTPTWGNMISEGSQLIPSIGHGAPVNIWIVLAPAIAMFTFILAINLIGDRLRSSIDVREGVL